MEEIKKSGGGADLRVGRLSQDLLLELTSSSSLDGIKVVVDPRIKQTEQEDGGWCKLDKERAETRTRPHRRCRRQ